MLPRRRQNRQNIPRQSPQRTSKYGGKINNFRLSRQHLNSYVSSILFHSPERLPISHNSWALGRKLQDKEQSTQEIYEILSATSWQFAEQFKQNNVTRRSGNFLQTKFYHTISFHRNAYSETRPADIKIASNIFQILTPQTAQKMALSTDDGTRNCPCG